jgi:hypothetical protein
MILAYQGLRGKGAEILWTVPSSGPTFSAMPGVWLPSLPDLKR